MSVNTGSGLISHRLELKGGGGKNMEYVFAAALGLIIIGSLVLTIYNIGGGKSHGADSELHFKCEKCGNEFVVEPEDIAPESFGPEAGPGPMYGPGMPMFKMDCPACSAKQSSIQMVKCPACEKYYVSETMKYPEMMMRGDEIKDKCPYCETDRLEWYRKKAKERRKK